MDIQPSYERYQRQMLLKEMGEGGQQKLLEAKVLVVGAGGLGCPALQYLAAAGVGSIGIVDDDVVSISNLHRQILYSANDVGSAKAEKAAAVLRALNPEIEIVAYNLRLTNQNAIDLFKQFDIVLDGSDNFSTRYMINDACVLLGKPLVYGAISRFEGQVAILNCVTPNSMEKPVNYRDLFPHPPAENEVMNCAEAGVLGVLPGIIGSMQANETIKLITGIGQPLINRLLTYNALNNQVYEIALTASADTGNLIPENIAAFTSKDYNWDCAVNNPPEVSLREFNTLLNNKYITIIDVRETGERPVITEFKNTHIPLNQLAEKLPVVNTEVVIAFCQS
ncbi:MAG TPA: HesA/MoeB/ThiF family protein, partial [Segetibacter sp.]